MGSYSDFIVEKQGAIAIVTLNRPDKGNSWTLATYQEMEKIQEELHYDEDVRVVIFTGAGDKFFCAGADLALLAKLDSYFISRDIYRYQGINTRWDRFIKPVIMALNGITVGSGLELALCGDIRIASSSSSFSINEVRIGLNPDMGGTQRLTRTVGPSQAKRLIFTAEKINAQEAARIGLVDIVTTPEDLMAEAMKMAEIIAGMPPYAIRFAKKAINLAVDAPLEVGLMYEEAGSIFCMGTEDKKEAVASILEKREPEFHGR
ncbi:enoyl-CoA hydratase/isomerase family protein [Desulfitobacterium sp. THU1]|uniref:enoyl-CoA hydratase/isomerase family protein n=1 Tax=Desulfitobacterium sp. THU1 TaxID=3138072 RepID=UPI00311EA370